jgi:electron transfer flavoprotein beta subunit
MRGGGVARSLTRHIATRMLGPLQPTFEESPAMKLAVCIKQVPDTEARLRVAADGRWIEEEDLPFVINESDEYAMEEALQIAERTGGEVVAVSLGPVRVREALRKCLAQGATRAIHLADEAFAGGDALSIGRALAAALSREGFDLVLTGSQSDDLGFGSTGSVIAGHLGWPHAWLVMGVELDEGGKSVKVTREMESGMNEVLRLELPAVLEIQAGLNHPRYASLKGIMQAKRKEVSEVSASDLGLDPSQIGAAGATVEMLSVAFPPSAGGAQMIAGDAATAAATLVDKLMKEARVL